MQLRWYLMLSCAGLTLLSTAPNAAAVSLIAMEEPVTALVPPVNANPFIPAMKYAYANGKFVATSVTSTPLLCANTSAPLAAGTTLNPVYYSGNAIGVASPLPFVFGASAATPTVSAQASGASNLVYKQGAMTFTADALGALVCYGVDANGARRLTRDIFLDDLEGAVYNSSVVLSVIHTPQSASDYYEYTIDVTLPPLPSGTTCGPSGLDCNFALVEGFDSSVFATTAANATSGLAGQWCLAPAGTQSCAFPPPSGGTQPVGGNINVNYTNYGAGGLPTLTAPISPAAAKTYHFVAFRYLKTGVNSVPSTGAPVVLAALFSPNDLEENKLDDNVSAGTNEIANAAPSVTQDATFTSFTGSLAALTEGTTSGTLTFDISDSDTDETTGPNLSAAVTLFLPGLSIPLTADCSTRVPNGGGAPTPVNRVCTTQVQLGNANAWNAAVSSTYDGLFNTVATDTTNGAYASGVGASAQIVATDSLGKMSAPVSVPVHIHSSANNPPQVAYDGTALPSTPDAKQGGTSYPTYSCSAGAKNCGGTFNVVELTNVITARPGPAAAFDELASQTTNINDVACGQANEKDAIFLNPPVVVPSNGFAGGYDLLFQLTSPLTTGSSLCSLTIADAMQAFPNGQTAKTSTTQFRIVVNL
jgi:hypothetical protein